MAKRMAPTFRSQSIIKASGPYGVKKDCRACRDDQSRAAALGRKGRQQTWCANTAWQKGAYWRDEGDEVDLVKGTA
jgi:hypothetical protein